MFSITQNTPYTAIFTINHNLLGVWVEFPLSLLLDNYRGHTMHIEVLISTMYTNLTVTALSSLAPHLLRPLT